MQIKGQTLSLGSAGLVRIPWSTEGHSRKCTPCTQTHSLPRQHFKPMSNHFYWGLY